MLVNTPAQAESLLRSLEQAAGGISLCANTNKTELICYKSEEAIPTLSGKAIKLVDQHPHLGSNISSTESECVYAQRRWGMLLTGYRTYK